MTSGVLGIRSIWFFCSCTVLHVFMLNFDLSTAMFDNP